MGYLAVAEGMPFVARGYFEEALLHYPNHPSAIVGLSNILLDIYSEVLLPPPTVPGIHLPDDSAAGPKVNDTTSTVNGAHGTPQSQRGQSIVSSTPLGLGGKGPATSTATASTQSPLKEKPNHTDEDLPAPYKATSLPLVDRLAARDRAYGLLSGLTRLGTGWNYSDAWFALARAYEESGQLDKAKEALWWCVELEEGMGARDWWCVGVGGYVL